MSTDRQAAGAPIIILMARGGRQLQIAALALLASAGLPGCAAPMRLPAGSRPAQRMAVYRSRDYARILTGRWRIIDRLAGVRSLETEPNILRRYAEIAGIRHWDSLDFLASGDVLLEAPGQRMRLDFHISGNELRLGPIGPHIEHDDWELTYSRGILYLRSLVDAETYTLKRSAAAAPPNPGAGRQAAKPALKPPAFRRRESSAPRR